MAALPQYLHDKALYAYGYLSGRSVSLSLLKAPSALATVLTRRLTTLITLPLPFFSIFALPLYGGTTTTINLLFFYLLWSSILASHGPLTVEVVGTLVTRLLFFALPALSFLAFDCAAPKVGAGIKARGERQLPLLLGQRKVLEVCVVALFNMLLGVALQAGLEVLCTRVLHLRSILKISSLVPLPWSVVKDVARGLALRGILHYAAHRFLLHAERSPLTTWHLQWQHSIPFSFSLVAAYDHPVNYLLAQWLPTFLPACLFRFHVLTWLVFVALGSLEDLFVYSGYAVLPSSIVLAGMARRTDAHFEAVTAVAGKAMVKGEGEQVGNFGHLGVLDWVLGTACKGESNVVQDIGVEVKDAALQQRIDEAVRLALVQVEQKDGSRGRDDGDEDGTTVPDEEPSTQRRSSRRKTRRV